MSLKIRITKDYLDGLGIAIFGIGHQINYQLIFGKPEKKQIEEGEILGPSLRIGWGEANEFMLALKEAIREYEGSTPDFSQGELKATKYHLEDLRSLLKIRGNGSR